MPERVEPSPLNNYSAPYLRAHATSHRIVYHRTSVAPYSHQVFLFHGHVWKIILCPSARHARSAVPSSHSGDFVLFLELLTPRCPRSKRQFPRKQVLLYPFMMSSSLVLVLWCHFPAIWLVEESSVLPPSEDFFIFPCFSVQKGQFCSRLQRERMCILAQFWVECIRLTWLVSSGESTRHVLVDELAASKSPYISTFHLWYDHPSSCGVALCNMSTPFVYLLNITNAGKLFV